VANASRGVGTSKKTIAVLKLQHQSVALQDVLALVQTPGILGDDRATPAREFDD
jgi:hypothetical protein